MDNTDAPLSELCSICHIHPPKYRCPRCSTRTCSLPCTRRHKLWSQCSGVRDPAAYLRRSELATEAAFDRDFNFITGIERSLERAEREVEDRGIELARGAVAEGVGSGEVGDAGAGAGAGRKRKSQGQGLVKGEAGFLRGAEAGAVRVVRAPKGMSRNKENSSRWHPKHKCLSWTVEWISAAGEKTLRNCLETCPVAEAYDRVFPPPRQERPNADTRTEEKEDRQEQTSASHDHANDATATATESATTDSTDTHPAQPSSSEAAEPSSIPSEKPQDPPLKPHRNLYFYLHRPRTTTKRPVLIPLSPSATLAAVLRDRTVLEFPTIYLLFQSPEMLLAEKDSSPFILEEEYLRTTVPEEGADQSPESEEEMDQTGLPGSAVNLEGVDEKKVLEVLKQDLFEPVPESVDK